MHQPIYFYSVPIALMPPEGSREFAHLYKEGDSHIVINVPGEGGILGNNCHFRIMFYDRGAKEAHASIWYYRNEDKIEAVKKLYKEPE